MFHNFDNTETLNVSLNFFNSNYNKNYEIILYVDYENNFSFYLKVKTYHKPYF